MGDIVEMMLEGFLCQVCCQFISDSAPGYPITCEDCKKEEENEGS